MDIRTILLVILIIGVIGACIYFGIQIMLQGSENIDYGEIAKENVVSTNNSNQNKTSLDIETLQSSSDNTSGDIQGTISTEQLSQIYGSGLYINNSNPKTSFGNNAYTKMTFWQEGDNKVIYYVPSEWERDYEKVSDPLTTATVECAGSKLSNYVEEKYNETTYDDVLNSFIEKERERSYYPDSVEFTKRDIETDSGKITVIEEQTEETRTEFLVFVKNSYELHLKLSIKTEEYNDDIREVFDNILCSYTII